MFNPLHPLISAFGDDTRVAVVLCRRVLAVAKTGPFCLGVISGAALSTDTCFLLLQTDPDGGSEHRSRRLAGAS